MLGILPDSNIISSDAIERTEGEKEAIKITFSFVEKRKETGTSEFAIAKVFADVFGFRLSLYVASKSNI